MTELVIPDTITEIGDFQFCGFDNLTKVYLPSTVQKIGRFGLGIDSKGTIYCEVNTKPNDWVNEWNQYSSKNT